MASHSGSPAAPAFGLASQTGTAIPETIGRYRLLDKIAKGGMAEVFAARSYGAHGFEKTVALKRILPKFGRDPQFVRMMVDEAKISVLLNHPNIAQILELGEQQGDYFIVMEFVPGQSLSAVVKRLQQQGERLPVLESCFVVVELLQGLHAAHIQRDASGKAAHIIHRDISPQNTLVSFDGHVKVIDFGIARARDRLEATEVGTIKGKLRYLAPEMIDPARFHPQGDFDHRVDVFAAGVVLWELVSGRTLFTGDDEMKVYDDITDGVTPDLHKEGRCDAALMKIIGRALERELSRRYATAEDFADDLRAYVYRSDPAFTHKRVAATLDRLFSHEKAMLLALERGQTAVVVEDEPPRATAVADAGAALGATVAGGRALASASGPSGAMSSRSPSRAQPLPDAAHDTRTVRADKLPSIPVGQAGAATAVVDLDDVGARGLPGQREVTVMTLVSRESVLGSAAALSMLEMPTGGGVFASGDDATVTVSSDKVRAALAAGDHAMQLARAPAVIVAPPTAAAAAPPASRHEVSETAPTRLRGAPPSPPPGRVGGGVVAASAAVGVVFALAIVGVVEHFTSPPASSLPSTSTPSQAVVSIVREVNPPDASVTVDGRPWREGLVVAVGAPVVVVVAAPGHQTVRRTLTPLAGRPLVVDVDLAREPALAPSEPVVVADADAGAVPARLVPAAPVEEEPDTPAGPATPSHTSPPAPKPAGREVPKAVAMPTPKATPPRGEGALLVKASPYWGQVSVDGRVLDEQTPVLVRLPAGKHDVVVSHPPRGLVQRFRVTIVAGQTLTRAITFE